MPKILVSCPSAEVANIAQDMAPKGFETVVVHNDAEVVPNLNGIEYTDHVSAHPDEG